MVRMTIELPDATVKALRRIADERGVKAEAIVSKAVKRLTVDLNTPKARKKKETVDDVIDYVLTKNAELYRRLA